MNLFRQLRDDIVDPKTPASVVLRKAKILAASLHYVELEQWLAHELNGYPDGSTLPSYRRLLSPVQGKFSGAFGSGITGFSIPVSVLPDFLRKGADNLPVAQGLHEIEILSESGRNGLFHIWPTEAVMIVRDIVRISGYTLIEMYQPITKAALDGIVDAVRTRFLDFLLALQNINEEVLESETALTNLPKEQVSHVFNVTVFGDNNVVATQSTIGDIAIQAVRAADTESLAAFLKKIGLTDEDVRELDSAIKQDGQPEKEKIGTGVSDWIGKMVSKAVSGSWKMAIGLAPEILKEAIFRHYGWK